MLTNNAYESSDYNNIQKQISTGIYNKITHQMKKIFLSNGFEVKFHILEKMHH